ncbi:hypothetical protein SAMN02910447_00596 [Ruminococcus sp. YE71]|uniref:hypothetical protein n=1 Tax=unclassified Ruminococcus TaxID=2608920 RepID=UPI0008800DFF|nr:MULTISPECIES: hypothetical protein [unclassified Ruminococcus]SDA12465.1 hypothetical protein SAMN02910446_00595 [Ruminococcus sp. YE78]SFW16966.1 hypothetical protein SAMN02910447_00596 [Ruminococcus sp. YE71]
MPSSLIHLMIADLFAKSHSGTERCVGSLPDFLLGSIAPDAVNIGVGMAPQEVRYRAHLRSRDIGEWLENIHTYRLGHEEEFADRPDLLKGVLMHLFTDIAWDNTVQPFLFDRMLASGIPRNELSRRKWAELSKLEDILLTLPYTPPILAELKKAVPRAVTSVTAEQLTDWQSEVLRRYEHVPAAPVPGILDANVIFTALNDADELMKNELAQ